MSGALDPAGFAQIALALHGAPDQDHTLELVVEYAQQATTCDYAGLVLLHGQGRLETAAVTDSGVGKVERLQTELDEGPALLAIHEHAAVVVRDTTDDPRWPRWGPLAAELGTRSVLSVRLFAGERTLGALNLYGISPDHFDADDAEVAGIFARHASIAVATAHEAAGLRKAIDARHLVGLAQGMIMERYGLDADRAFAVLRRLSRDNNLKLRTVAERVIATRQLPAEP